MATQYREVLEPQERLAAFRLGACLKFASIGVRPSEIDAFVKQAGPGATSALFSPTGAAKMVATVAILTGVPLGVAAHVIGKRITGARGREKELQSQIGYYRNASQQLETGLAGAQTSM
jgi:hypothetical protein